MRSSDSTVAALRTYSRFRHSAEPSEKLPRSIHGGLPLETSELEGISSWTPDNKWIAFGGAPSQTEAAGIWLVAVDGRQIRRLTEPGSTSYGDWQPAFSAQRSVFGVCPGRSAGIAWRLRASVVYRFHAGRCGRAGDARDGDNQRPGLDLGTIADSCSRGDLTIAFCVACTESRSRPLRWSHRISRSFSRSEIRRPRSIFPAAGVWCTRWRSEIQTSGALR